MRNIDSFFLTYALLTFSTVFVLSLLDQNTLDVYLVLFVVEFFIASELNSPLTPTQSRRRTHVGMVLIIIFAAILVRRIIEILGI